MLRLRFHFDLNQRLAQIKRHKLTELVHTSGVAKVHSWVRDTGTRLAARSVVAGVVETGSIDVSSVVQDVPDMATAEPRPPAVPAC